MMEYKALYIHIPKTGGSSICKAPWILKHGSYDKSPKIPMASIESLILSFTFVRNPYTRFVSGVLNHGYATPKTFEKFVTTTFLKEYKKRFEEWSWPELQPQYRYIFFNGKDAVDFVGQFELLESGWAFVCGFVGERFKLPHENKGKYQDHMGFYSKKTKEIVGKAYSEDFNLFYYCR